jgi:hypothetical protein
LHKNMSVAESDAGDLCGQLSSIARMDWSFYHVAILYTEEPRTIRRGSVNFVPANCRPRQTIWKAPAGWNGFVGSQIQLKAIRLKSRRFRTVRVWNEK